MGSILAFRPRKSAKAGNSGRGTQAMVIIFPGVRYEQLGAVGDAMKWTPVDWRAWQRPTPVPVS
jgi:hypothetical protein